MGPEHLEYLKIFLFGKSRVLSWANSVSSRYLSLQTYWPQIMESLWNNRLLARRLVKMGTARLSWRRVQEDETDGDEE